MSVAFDCLAGLYDLIWPGAEGDTEFYYNAAKGERPPILELGCGTGRITVPLACAGMKVVGIDISGKMIEEAEKKLAKTGKISGNIRFEKQDMRNFQLPEKFGACIIPFRSFLMLLSIKDQEDCLKCIYNHLKAEGKLIFNIFVPDLRQIVKGRIKTDKKVINLDGQNDAEYYFDSKFDRFNQTIEAAVNISYKDGKTEKTIKQKIKFNVRYIFPFEMYHLLTKCGFKVLSLYGDFDRKEFTKDSTEMIWVCEKI